MGVRARRLVAVAAVAGLTLVSLAVLAWERFAAPTVVVDGSATLDGLTLDLRGAEWVPMEHLDPSFQMPGQMMPGAPEGDEVRLGVRVTLSNTDATTREFNPVDEFALVGGVRSEPAELSADTIGTLPRLGPHAAVDGTLYFDVEVPGDQDPPLQLRWSRAGDVVLLSLPNPGGAPEHGHE
jgi:hypothetical protein